MTSRESYFANIGRVQDCLLNSNFKFSELRNAGQLGYMISNETYDHKRLVIDFSLTGAALNVMGSNDFGKTLAWFNYDQELMEQILLFDSQRSYPCLSLASIVQLLTSTRKA